jgi:hypothetical protein
MRSFAMAAAIPNGSGWTELVPGSAFVGQDGTQYPANWLGEYEGGIWRQRAAPEDIAAIGGVTIVEPPAAPDGKRNLPGLVGDNGGVPTRLYDVANVPPPVPQQSQPVVGGFTVASSVVSINPNSLGIASVLRVSAGRYRAYFDPPQPDDRYVPSLSIRDASNRQYRVTAKLPAYAEIRTFDQTWVAADTQEIGIILNRVSWT